MQLEDLINHLKTAPYYLDNIVITLTISTLIILAFGIWFERIKKNQKKAITTIIASTILMLISLTIVGYLAINNDHTNYTLSRSKTHLYIQSHSDYLKSAKLKIVGNDEYSIYVKYNQNTYRIPIIPLKEKN